MKTSDFIDIVRNLRKSVFTTADVARIIDKKDSYVRVYLHRIKKHGYIEEIERGKYALRGTDPMLIASNIVFPSYISFLSGLKFHGMTTQLPRTVFVACAKSKREIKKEDYSLRFVRLKSTRIFGYMRETYRGKKSVFVGEPEKVIVDSLLLPEYCPVDETFSALMENEFDEDKLVEYGVKMESIVLLKRLGYLSELKGKEMHEKLKGRLNRRYDLLNPSLPREGRKDETWKLIVNEDLEV